MYTLYMPHRIYRNNFQSNPPFQAEGISPAVLLVALDLFRDVLYFTTPNLVRLP